MAVSERHIDDPRGETLARVVVLGGGAAGMSCALWLHHLGLTPVVVDPEPDLGGVLQEIPRENFWVLGMPGLTSREIGERFAAHLAREEIRRVHGEATSIARTEDGRFAVTLTAGEPLDAAALVVGVEGQVQADGILDAADEAHARVGLFFHDCFSGVSVSIPL